MVLLVVALLAAQTDAGPVSDAGPPPALCGAITEEGACFNDTAAFCSEPNADGAAAAADLLVENCAGGRCAVIEELGAWCFAQDGARCAFEAGERASTHACGPVGPTPDPSWGCDLVEGCVSLSTAGCGDGCADATHLRVGCASFAQPVLFSCASFGGSCAGVSCTGLGAGSPCDERLICADGFECVEGACVADAAGWAIDAGPAEPQPPPAPPPLCGAGAGGAGLALAALLAARRRASPPDSRP